jgi:hypothetical protein
MEGVNRLTLDVVVEGDEAERASVEVVDIGVAMEHLPLASRCCDLC